MKFIKFSFLYILYTLIQCFGEKIQINILTYTFASSDGGQEYPFEQQFEEYAIKNNLNITAKVEIMKFTNPSDSYANFKSLVESSLKKSNNIYNDSNNEIHSTKFDIYIYDNRYTNIYGPYLLDLKDNLPKGFIEMYDSKIVSELCTYNDKVVGLPWFLTYEILYSNRDLLNKYNKSIPKTWNELIETCKFIMDKEKDDPELICYNGLFDDSEQGLYSLYEFIYSCRDSKNSTYPNPQDQIFKDSLIMLKKLKDDTESDTIFRSNENFTIMKLSNGKFLFLKYWFLGEPYFSDLPYNRSNLPGMKEDISGTNIVGNNFGIIKNIPKEKKDAAIEVFKFFTSKEFQKKKFESHAFTTAINELWYDEKSCKNGFCDIIRDVQYTGEPKFIKNGPENYKKKYQQYINQYLYENKTVDETLKQINDVTKVYYVSLNTDNSNVGLTCFILFSVISSLMLLSLILIFREDFQPFFAFLPIEFWIITVIGSILFLWIPITNYGSVTTLKCHLKPLLLSVGFTLSFFPSMHNLIILFPKENKLSQWVNDNKYIFFLFSILIDVLLNCISLINMYTPKLVLIENGENFEVCKFNGEYYSIIILLVYKLLMIFSMLYLIFIEWDNPSIKYYLKYTVSALYIDILSLFLIYVYHFIKIKNYELYFILQTALTSIVSISNYIFLFVSRIFLKFIKIEELTIEQVSTNNFKFVINASEAVDSYFKSDDTNNTYNSESTKIIKK